MFDSSLTGHHILPAHRHTHAPERVEKGIAVGRDWKIQGRGQENQGEGEEAKISHCSAASAEQKGRDHKGIFSAPAVASLPKQIRCAGISPEHFPIFVFILFPPSFYCFSSSSSFPTPGSWPLAVDLPKKRKICF